MTLTACGNDEATATEINDLQAKVRVLQKEVGALTIQVNELKSGGETVDIIKVLRQHETSIQNMRNCQSSMKDSIDSLSRFGSSNNNLFFACTY